MANENTAEFGIAINDGTKDAIRALRDVRGGSKEAITRALNGTIGTIKSAAADEASSHFTVNEQSVKDGMMVSRATASKPSITVSRRGPRFQARRFPLIPNVNPGIKGGKAAAIRPWRNGAEMVLGAEVVQGRNGPTPMSKAFLIDNSRNSTRVSRGTGLYRRVIGKKNSSGGRSALVLARGLSVPDMLNEYPVRSVVEERAEAKLQLELDREIRALLKKAGAE